MWAFLTSLWSGFVSFLAILLPFGKKSAWKITPVVRWTLFIVLLALILVGLYFLNRSFAHLIRSELLRDYWLPLLFLLVLLILWTTWAIWKLLMAAAEPSSFPDIDAAWDEAIRGLALAGIRIGDMPLFLVLGRPEAPEEHFFNAAQLGLVVKQTPPGPNYPLHVYASRDAIYITCPGASLMGKHAANVALEGIVDLGGGDDVSEPESPDGQNTIRPGGKEKKVIKRLMRMAGRQMNVVERRTSRRELGLPMPDLMKNPGEVEMLRARLAHLARLIVRDRHPFCPINGLMVLVPVGGTDNEPDAQQTAELLSRDLSTLRSVLRLQYPTLVLACDIEALPGFSEFIQRVAAKERVGRLGQRFPLASPDLAGEALYEQIDRSIHHLCNSYLRDWVYRLFRADGGNAATVTNTGLYLFLDEMRARKKNLSRVLVQGIAKDSPLPLLYAGCYLAGTGADASKEQSFIAGVFKRLMENQSVVSWTMDALTEDRRCHSRANLGYTLLAGLAIALVAALGYIFFLKPPTG